MELGRDRPRVVPCRKPHGLKMESRCCYCLAQSKSILPRFRQLFTSMAGLAWLPGSLETTIQATDTHHFYAMCGPQQNGSTGRQRLTVNSIGLCVCVCPQKLKVAEFQSWELTICLKVLKIAHPLYLGVKAMVSGLH